MMRMLVVGGSGFLGGEVLSRAVGAGHDVVATYLSRCGEAEGVSWHRLDLRQRADVAELVQATGPDVVVNAAYRQTDWASTADGPAHLALAANAAGARLVHVSSDAVFAGGPDPYDETATPSPITPYGAAKAAAETAVLAICPAAVVARTSLILGSDGRSSHERYVHELATGRSTGVLFTDDVRCPVHVGDLAAALLELAGADHRAPDQPAPTGIHHLAGPQPVNRYQLGRLIARRDDLDADRLRPGLRAGSPHPGPLRVELDSRRTQAALLTRLRGVTEFLSGR